jgi:hypothetical protein
MFVRWHSRKRRHPAFGGPGKQIRGGYDWAYTRLGTSEQDKHWAAIIVESVRVGGRPTQRHVAYLGGITESAIEIDAQRAWFWDEVSRRLDRLANRVSVEDRKRIEAAVAAKVPPVTKKQYEEIVRRAREIFGAGWKLEPGGYFA